ncbi:MAG: hypothetical protein ACYTGQ_16705, partial [Planctomycetota bacterium]
PDLDGTTIAFNELRATTGDIQIIPAVTDPFNGLVNVGANHRVDFDGGWTLADFGPFPEGQVDFSGGTSPADAPTIGGGMMNVRGNVNLDGVGKIEAPTEFFASAVTTLGAVTDELILAGATTIHAGATFQGPGTVTLSGSNALLDDGVGIEAVLKNTGHLDFGPSSVAAVSTNGFVQTSGGATVMTIGGPGNLSDHLDAEGAAVFAGTLDLRLAPGYTPPVERFTLINHFGYTGAFDTVLGQASSVNGLLLIPLYEVNQLDVMSAIPGDFNLDGSVGVPDLITWASFFGSNDGGFQAGDANLDGVVGVPDLIVWASHFGQSAADYATLMTQVSATAIPEPGGVVWLGLLGWMCCAQRRRLMS